MANSIPNCGICELRHLSMSSTVWCSECDEGLCDSCTEHHRLSKASRNHETVPISTYLELPIAAQEIRQICAVHGENFQSYCKEHNCPCCRKCVVASHNKCQNLANLEDVVQGVKTSTLFLDLEKTIFDIIENIKMIKKDRNTNIKTLDDQKCKIREEIRQMKMQLCKKVEELEANLIKELDFAVENKTKSLNALLDSVSKREMKISRVLNLFEAVKAHGTELQTFLAIQEIENDTRKEENALLSMEADGSLCECELSCSFNEECINLLSSICRLGQIDVTTSDKKIILQREKDKQAQFLLPIIPVNQIKLHLKQKIITSGESIRGITTLPGERLAFSSLTNKTVTISDMNGSNLSRFSTPTWACDLSYIEKEIKIAVASGGYSSHRICLFDILKMRITDSFNLPSYVDSVDAKEDYIICAVSEIGLYEISLKKESRGNIRKLFDIDNYDCYVVVFNDKIYISNSDNHKVLCVDFDGNIEWTFANETKLNTPRGIAVDRRGFIFVVGNSPPKVVVLSPDGKSCKQVLSIRDGLDSPRAIHYDVSKHELIVANTHQDIFRYTIQ